MVDFMQIHVVSPGESVDEIARRYGVAPRQIIELNHLSRPNQLVVGETLLIPTVNRYTVQTGDSIWSVARKFGIEPEALIRANPGVSPETLRPGTVLQLPRRERYPAIVNGYLEPHEGVNERFQEAASALTYLTVFSYHVDRHGNLTAPDASEAALLQAVRGTRVSPFMAITNIDGGAFSRDVANAILGSNDVQNRLIDNVLRVMREKGYRGLNIDFEFLGRTARRAYNRFVRKVSERLHQENFLVSSALAPKTSGAQVGEWYEAHDYQYHGQVMDFVILMTYEWGWSGGPPMPVSPITQVRRVVDYARSVIPARKILMSIPLYGYDWMLPYEPGGEFARALTYRQAVDLAWRYHARIEFDDREKAAYFRYTDENGKQHIVYFNDLQTMEAMFALVRNSGLRGMSFWNLAFRFPQVWPLITDRFAVR
ncbi:LysM peptidoglycan-binding domain-containing protein [Caenibacillus caldisaponilyticus]|uniref:LysM peptidoglycan-binding domain-containing protein n=1 Tax=Caenibacillus caldisaponilyticus TaxID=1674942 RepID=UPI0009888151|nr:glycoside hydrolase family 18 protein [Caenibacillus caldisaponilyticus]